MSPSSTSGSQQSSSARRWHRRLRVMLVVVVLGAVFWRLIATTVLIGSAQIMIAAGHLSVGRSLAESAVALGPNDATAQFELGRVLMMSGGDAVAEAVAPLRRALAGNPRSVERLARLGTALLMIGRADEAVVYLEKARDLSPDSLAIRKSLGQSYLTLNRPASARREFQEALIANSDPELYLGLAVAWAGNDEPELARRCLALAVARDSHLFALAADYPALRRLQGEPEFIGLLDSWRSPGESWRPD